MDSRVRGNDKGIKTNNIYLNNNCQGDDSSDNPLTQTLI